MSDPLRTELARLLEWKDAHVDFDTAVADVPAEIFPEHMCISQPDILECPDGSRFRHRRVLLARCREVL
jgi:hypothetical protein